MIDQLENLNCSLALKSSTSIAVIAFGDLIEDFDEDGFEEAFIILKVRTLASCGAESAC